MFDGDIRLQRVEQVMMLARNLTVAEMKAVVRALTQLHDSIVMDNNPMWKKDDRCGK